MHQSKQKNSNYFNFEKNNLIKDKKFINIWFRRIPNKNI